MSNSMRRKSRLLIPVLTLLFVTGCQTLLTNPIGRVVQDDKRISIPEAGEWTGVYKNEDLALTYRMSRSPGRLNIAGSIQFTRRVAENFPVVGYFHMDIILIDAQGRTQSMAGLTSVSNYNTEYITPSDPPITFNVAVSVPENTKSVSFSYTGRAYDPTEDGGGMDFWEYPFK